MKLVKCNKCGKVFPNNLSNCPDCFEKNPKYVSIGIKVLGCFLIIFGVFVSMFSILFSSCSFSGDSTSNKNTITTSQTQSEAAEEKAEVNLKNFEKIENGMTYEQVVEIFGKEGKVVSEFDLGLGEEYVLVTYSWSDKTNIANCTIVFEGGKVSSKGQIGLR